jgi:hypothetical protein
VKAGNTGAGGTLTPVDRFELLGVVHGQIQEVSRELTAQVRRIERLQGELDELRENVGRLLNSQA